MVQIEELCWYLPGATEENYIILSRDSWGPSQDSGQAISSVQLNWTKMWQVERYNLNIRMCEKMHTLVTLMRLIFCLLVCAAAVPQASHLLTFIMS
jgi:hypothetical protein